MLKFEQERINKVSIHNNNFKLDIPAIVVNPKQITDSSVVIIFTSGLGNNNLLASCMNNKLFDENWFVSYDKAMHGDNKNEPSQFKKAWLDELDSVVDYVKQQYPNRKVFLIGESWGSAINFVYYKNNPTKVNGTVNWNSPMTVINPEKVPFKTMLKVSFIQLGGFLFNINKLFPHIQNKVEAFTSDPILARLLRFEPDPKRNTRCTLAVWRFMKPTNRFLKKHGKDPNYNFLYIQTKQDVLQTPKTINGLVKSMDQDHLQLWETGRHILQFEPVESNKLYETIANFIKK